MLSVLAKKLSILFIQANIVKQEDYEIYAYSFELLLSTVLNFMMLAIVALMTKRLLETACFVIGFIPVRRFAGGYHAKTHFRCLSILLVTYFALLTILTLMSADIYRVSTILNIFVSAVIIWMISPVGDRNKPLSEKEKHYYRRQSRVTMLVYAAVIIPVSFVIRTRIEVFCISFGILAVSVSLVAAWVKNKITNMLSMAQSLE